jgi:hypothetical protein
MRGVLVVVALGLALAGASGPAGAGPSYSLGREAVCAEGAVEVELTFDRSEGAARLVARSAAAKQRFPDRLSRRALAGARVTETFFGGPSVALPKPLDFYLHDRKWRAAFERGRVRALLFVRRREDQPKVLFGVNGVPVDTDPDYDQVRAAVVRYAGWRQHPGDAAAVAEAEKVLATTANFSVATLASLFLCQAGHADVIARATRAAAPSSPATQLGAGGTCPMPPGSCTSW